MPVPEQTPYVEYTVNGSTTDFSLPFDCDNADNLIVKVNDVEAIGTWTLQGSIVVFITAPIANSIVSIERNTPLERTTNYQTYDDSFSPKPVNKDFDRVWWKLQELGYKDSWILQKFLQEVQDRIAADQKYDLLAQGREYDLKLYLESVINNLIGNNILPLKDSYIQTEDGTTQRTYNRKTVTTVETVAELLAISNPRDGQTVSTKGFYGPQTALAIPYIGGGTYTYNSAYASINDGGLVLNGWVRQGVGGTVELEWFGAKQGDYTTDSAALVAAAATGYSIRLAKVMYNVNTPVTFLNRGQTVFGAGWYSGFILGTGVSNGTASSNFFTFTKLSGTTVVSGGGMQDLRIEAAARTGGYVIDVFKANYQLFHNLIINNAYGAVIARKFNNLMFTQCGLLSCRGTTAFYADGTNYRSDLLKFNFCNISGSASLYQNSKPSTNSPVNLRIVGNIQTVQVNTLLSLGSRIAFYADSHTPTEVSSDADNSIGTKYTPSFIRVRNLESDFAYFRTVYLNAATDVTFLDCYLHGAQTDCNVYIESGVSAATFENCRVTSANKQGYSIAGKNIKILGGDVCYSSNGNTGLYSAIDVKSGADGVYCFGVNTGYYYSSNTIYQNYGLNVNAGATDVQFIGGELAGTVADWYDGNTGTNARNVIVKDYQGTKPYSHEQYMASTPTEAGSTTIDARYKTYLFNNSALSAYTLVLPANFIDGQEVEINFQAAVTALTLSVADSTQTINTSPTSIAITKYQTIKLKYRKSSLRWYIMY